jgi:hypothetical protein
MACLLSTLVGSEWSSDAKLPSKTKSEQNMSTQNQELSEKAKTNLQRNAELREKDNIYFNPQPGEKSIWIFDAEKVEPVEKEFDGKKVQRFQYTIKDPNTGQEKYWTASKRTSEQIDAYLTEGHCILKIQRIGSGKDTRYNLMPS